MSWIQIWKKSKKQYTWKHVDRACDGLSKRYDEITLPKTIIALARGGLVPATILANKLGVRHVYSLGISSYDEGVFAKPGELNVYQRLPINRRMPDDEIVLIVDDISDKGHTFNFAKQYIQENVCMNTITMSLVSKPGTAHEPDYVYDHVPAEQWVVFPWEND